MEEAKKLNLEMNESDFDEFSKALDDNSFEQYAEEYINKHRDENLTSDDVLSLALIYALQNAHDYVQKILSVPYHENIFTTADEYGYNAIYFLLHSCSAPEEEEIRNLVSDHLKNKKVTKVDLKGETFVNLCGAMERSLFEGMLVPDQVRHTAKKFLQYVYTEESIGQLNEEFGIEQYFEEFDKNTDSFLDPEHVLPEVQHHRVLDEKKRKSDMINDANGGNFADKVRSENLKAPQIWWDI